MITTELGYLKLNRISGCTLVQVCKTVSVAESLQRISDGSMRQAGQSHVQSRLQKIR